ncbi:MULTISPECIES: EpsG family protein [Proteus]|uniref:Wzy n=1 Tax=Proteus penneri TaxID=102862 RepID=A0A385JP23_9GAMM|nr:wzy [Proteus penneri]NBL76577.1 hypothetical protein [Proteus sp. G2672]NBL90233.1 hypothetical protein [Proteus sp. G2673]
MVFSFILYNFILFSSTLFIFLFNITKSKYIKHIFIFISFFIVFIPSALRYNIGTDYRTYVEIFNKLKLYHYSYVEFGYTQLNQLIISLNLTSEYLFAIVAFLTYFFIYLTYSKSNKSYIFHFLFICTGYFSSFYLLRSTISLSICIFAIALYLNNSKVFIFLLLIFIASLFHKAALIYMLIPILGSMKLKKLYINLRFIILLSIFVIFIFKDQLVTFVFHSKLIDILGYSDYVSSELFSKKTSYGSGLGILLRALPLIIIILLTKKLLTHDKRNSLIIFTALISIISIIFSSTIEIFSRLEKMFIFSYMFGIIAILQCPTIKFRNFYCFFFILVYLLIFELTIINSSSYKCEGARITPYVSILNKEDDQSLNLTRIQCEKL